MGSFFLIAHDQPKWNRHFGDKMRQISMTKLNVNTCQKHLGSFKSIGKELIWSETLSLKLLQSRNTVIQGTVKALRISPSVSVNEWPLRGKGENDNISVEVRLQLLWRSAFYIVSVVSSIVQTKLFAYKTHFYFIAFSIISICELIIFSHVRCFS